MDSYRNNAPGEDNTSGNNTASEELTGYSDNLSFEDALKDALSKRRTNLPTDYYQYVVTETGYETGGFANVNRLFVRIRRTIPG
ncbi:MAG TPA: hypothetical protein VGB46_11555 [Flavisolibacter sp.]|jgi:hypothetical protein